MRDFMFADDCFRQPAMPLDSPSDKTEVMFQSTPHTNDSDPTITVNGKKLQTVDKFTYLGSTLSRNVLIDNEADIRIAKESILSEGFVKMCGGHHNRYTYSLNSFLKALTIYKEF